MKNKRLLSPKEAAFELGISVKTVQRWDEAGILRTVRTAGNQRRIPIEEIARLRMRGEGKQGAERCVLYARVASGSQEGHWAQQTERLKEAARARGYEVVQIITEQASSLNERRSGMNSLLSLIGAQAADVVLVEYPDRLVRFGFSYLEQAFGWLGVRLEVLDPPNQLHPTDQLVQDVLTIVTVFAGRLYGQRAKGIIRKRVQTALQECAAIPAEGRDGTSQQDHQTAS